MQAAVRARRLWVAAVLWTLSVIAVLPLTIVPLALGRDGAAELLLDDRWAAAATTIVAGLLLMAAFAQLFAHRAARDR